MAAVDHIARAMAMDAQAEADGKADLVNGKVPASELPSTDTATQGSTALITSGGVYTIVGNINAVLEEVL